MAYVERAEEHLEKGDLDLAQAEAQKALDKDPEYGHAHMVNARVLIAQGDLDAALQSVGLAGGPLSASDQTEVSHLRAELSCKTDPWLADVEYCAQYLEEP